MALIIAAIVLVLTLALTFLQLFATGMSDNPSQNSGCGGMVATVIIGVVLAVGIAATHWISIVW